MYLVLFVFMYLGLTTCDWMTYHGVYSWKRPSLSLLAVALYLGPPECFHIL